MPRYSLRKNFKPGDLLYGLENDRATYFAMVTHLGGYFVTADRYNHIVLEPQLDDEGDFDSTNLRESIETAASSHSLSSRDVQRLYRYSDFLLRHPQYAPTRGGGKDNKAIEGAPKIRRACKAAIDYITSTQGRRLHFLLDSINMSQVIAKADESFTGSELRYIYRRWNLDPDVRKRVWFYRNGIQVEPPWVTHQSAWNAYRPKSLQHS